MRPETLQSYVRAQPFLPFRLVMNSGEIYAVRHPEMIRVGRDVCVYYHASAPDAPFERFETMSMLLIQNVEHLAPAPGWSRRGQLVNRHSRFQQNDLNAERLARPVDLRQLKKEWLEARERAERLFEKL